MNALVWWSFGCAALPTILFLRNLSPYAPPPRSRGNARPQVSVLIPARDEEKNIEPAIASVLANENVELEVIVLDDHSTDRTAEIVSTVASGDCRVRLECAPELPANWCGKQHACWVLAQHASFPLLVFIDADVRLAADALARCAAFMEETAADLASGVPRQITETWLEKLLIPLVHFVLLGFLPLERMRKDLNPSFGAGCGQLFVARRDGYFRADGHREIRGSMHDGVSLPRAFRRAGLRTDLFDATSVATCRMYSSAREVWNGLAKNATEGLASLGLIGPVTVLLVSGQVLPWLILFGSPTQWGAWGGALLSLLSRLLGVIRFQQPVVSALLHPLGVLVLLAIQWKAFVEKLAGKPSSWRGRTIQQSCERAS